MAITRQRIKKIEKEINLANEKERVPRLRDLHSDDPIVAAKADRLLCAILEKHHQEKKLWSLQNK